MRAAGPLPIPVPDTAGVWLAERRARLACRLAEVERKAETDALEDVQLSLGRLRISPLKAITPEEADIALAPLYAHLPAIRITDLLAEVDRWTGFSQCFTHLQSSRVADEPRAILTAVLADATNLGHTRMAEACNLVTQRQLGWLASWHLREETYGRALARLVDAQHTAPLAALFGSGTSSSSDGQNFPLDRRAQATGAVNPHKGAEPGAADRGQDRRRSGRGLLGRRAAIGNINPHRRLQRVGYARTAGLLSVRERPGTGIARTLSPVPSSCGTRPTCKPPGCISPILVDRFRRTCSNTSRRSAGSTSISPEIISGPISMRPQPRSGRFAKCAPSKARQNLSVYLGPFYVPTPSRYLREDADHLLYPPQFNTSLICAMRPQSGGYNKLLSVCAPF
jgi:hypothetical protein